MWWLVHWAYNFLYNSILEFIFFILVDIVAKSPLKESRTDAEKRSVWLYESLFLGLVCFFIYLLDHNPLLLIGLTTLTLLYSQLAGRVDLNFWWSSLSLRWEEYQQHTDNLSRIQALQQRLQELPWRKSVQLTLRKPVERRGYLPGFLSSFVDKVRNVTGWVYKAPESEGGHYEPPVNDLKKRFLMDTAPVQLANDRFKTSTQVALDSGYPSTSAAASSQQFSSSPQSQTFGQALNTVGSGYHAQNVRTSTGHGQLGPVSQSSNVALQQTPNRVASSWFASNDLKRRPLRSSSSFKPVPIPSFPGTGGQSLRSKFASAFGFGGGWSSKPVGLKNEGQNLCFMNSVVQCLARSPCLVKELSREMNDDIDCSVAESVLVSSFVELITTCSDKPGKHKVLEPAAFKEAVSVLNNHLVAPLGERQFQQDAAEFIMWLMETLVNILNKKCSREDNGVSNVAKASMLKFIYGDLTPSRINDLKEACRREINEANGLDNDSYAEPIQRLSDLEWLSYKQKNKSTIDNLFTGQLVEAYHCLSDNHLSVNMQTFNILPVPIVAPQSMSGLVFLEDCFTKFCNVEHLVGQEGLVCSICNNDQGVKGDADTPILSGAGRAGRSKRSVRNASQRHTTILSADSAVHSPLGSGSSYMSPIPGQREGINDSGFHDNVFRTSTPVGEQLAPTFPTRFLRDAQRRCLLRQLPDCLVIQLLRFTYNQFSQQSRKISAPISIPLKGLDLTSIVYDKVTNREDLTAAVDSYKYDLYGICVHLGSESTSCGHYIAYCKESNGIWYKFDDDLVWDVNMEFEITTREVRENAYLLFYKRALVTQEKS